ncbi:helix-turn-helix domain-containing protein [Ferroplasma sp.]|uniref:helix-turn-helix domain-containing protein n=1 Tax=Ferroplasma sp. TaxID=2591003 RepID=UPI00307D397E
MNKSNTGIKVNITMKRSDCEVTSYVYANFPGTVIERLKIDGKTTTHRISFNLPGELNKAFPDIKKISIESVKAGDRILWAKASCCSACYIIGSSDSVVLGSKALNSNTVSYSLLLPSYAKLTELKRKLEESNINYSITDLSFGENQKVTQREKEIIIKLYENGYFDPERKLNMTQIAEQLDISTAALSEILRKTLRKIVKEYIEQQL